MGDRTSSALLLPLIAILAVVLPGAIGGTRQPPSTAAASPATRETLAAAATASQPRTAAALIHEYYEVTAFPAPPSKSGATSVQLRVEGKGPDGSVQMNVAATKEASAAPPSAPA